MVPAIIIVIVIFAIIAVTNDNYKNKRKDAHYNNIDEYNRSRRGYNDKITYKNNEYRDNDRINRQQKSSMSYIWFFIVIIVIVSIIHFFG
ncbi:hypothetical protein [Clostridium perfringens]|uniref:hypothetical protein n=1 Tax=Clostridium perfringens TaxID=1502 RepID=UPI002A2DCDE8|nr:hypothetical protein [Clostridium perfringens]